jgi:ketosteroid isomerase-like protein
MEPTSLSRDVTKFMTDNKKTVELYLEGFRRSDHAVVLSCLTDEVEWVIPGMFHIRGKVAFDKEIENEAFTGSPTIIVSRLTEEDDVVLAEGTVRAQRKDGGVLHAVFCDAFEMAGAKIKKLTSYLMEVKEEREANSAAVRAGSELAQ